MELTGTDDTSMKNPPDVVRNHLHTASQKVAAALEALRTGLSSRPHESKLPQDWYRTSQASRRDYLIFSRHEQA